MVVTWGNLDDPNALKPLKRILEDRHEEPEIRTAADTAIKKIKTKNQKTVEELPTQNPQTITPASASKSRNQSGLTNKAKGQLENLRQTIKEIVERGELDSLSIEDLELQIEVIAESLAPRRWSREEANILFREELGNLDIMGLAQLPNVSHDQLRKFFSQLAQLGNKTAEKALNDMKDEKLNIAREKNDQGDPIIPPNIILGYD